MGSLIRRFRVVDGKRVKRKKWYGRFLDENGKPTERALSVDKGVSRRMLVKMEQEAADVRDGITTPIREHALRSLNDHLNAYRSDLHSRQVTSQHISETIGQCEKIISGCRFRRIADLSVSAVSHWLSNQPFSQATRNRYVTAIKGFARWLQIDRRCPEHRLVGLSTKSINSDRRHERRCLSDADLHHLLQTTRHSRRIDQGSDWRFTGEDRYLLYLTAARTGLRAAELASMTAASFNFDPSGPTFTVEATSAKNGKTAILPLNRDLSGKLEPFISGKDDALWPGSWAEKKRGGAILQRDLKEAGIPYRDSADRVFDFHALRMQFITGLVRADVPLRKAQDLARHSTPVLTANVYTSLHTTDLAESVNRLSLPGDELKSADFTKRHFA